MKISSSYDVNWLDYKNMASTKNCVLFHKSAQFLTLTSDKTAGITENFTEFFFVRNIFYAVKT